jgi:TonB family protein
MKNIKLTIMKNRPEVSDEEIQRYMDFDGLLQQQAAVIRATRQKAWIQKGLLMVGGIALISIVWYYRATDNSTPEVPTPISEQPIPIQEEGLPSADDTQFVPPDDSDKVSEPDQAKQQPSQVTTTPTEDKKQQDEPIPAETAYEQAFPVAGYPALYQYFNTSLVYPPEAIRDSIQGIVTVTFMVNRDGKPERITIENSPDVRLDKEAIRLIENMPAWNPATLNGKPVPSKLSIPITFQLIPVKSKE